MVKKVCEKIRESIINFNANPVDSFGVFLPVAISIIVFISGVVSYVMFIINGGYTEQVEKVKSFGLFAGYEEKFTMGNTETIIPEGVGMVIAFLIVVEFVLMMINYFRNNEVKKRIIMIVDLFILIFHIIFVTIIWRIAIDKLHVSDETSYEALVFFYEMLDFLDKFAINPMIILFIYAVSILASVLGFIVLVITTSECWRMIGYTVINLFISYLVIPLVFLFLENVIPLVTGAVAIAIIIVVVIIAFVICVILSNVLGRGGTDTSIASSRSSSGASYNNRWEDKDKKSIKQTSESEKNCKYISNYNELGGVKLYRVKGIMYDYVELYNGVGTSEICSLDMLRKGKFHIYDKKTKREIKESEIPWR